MISRNIMNCLRRYVSRVEQNKKQATLEIERLDPYRGSVYYSDQAERIQKESDKKRAAMGESCAQELSSYLKTMRENVKNRVSKAPTAEQVATLNILSKLDNLTIKDVELYADAMKDCPLAMRHLSQIARGKDIGIYLPDPVDLLGAVDALEANLSSFIENYKGDTEQSGTVLERQLIQILSLDDETVKGTRFGSLERADQAAWNSILLPSGNYDPAAFEGETPVPMVKRFYNDLPALIEAIKAEQEGLSPVDATKKENEILSECPENYGAILRNFRATGEVLPLQ